MPLSKNKPRRATRKSRESELVTAILAALTARRIWAIRINAGQIHKHCAVCGGVHLRLAEPGTPDIWTEYGWLEVKDLAPVSQSQVAWHAKALERGVRFAIVHSISEALAAVKRWQELAKRQQAE